MRKSKAYPLTIRSLFIAILIVQSLVPFLGYIPLGFMNLTIIQITVILGAILLGPKDGLYLGFAWGLIKLILAYTAPNSLMDTLVFRNPIITIIPRMLVGLFAGLCFQALYHRLHSIRQASLIAAIVGSLTNTCFVLSFIWLFARGEASIVYHTSVSLLSKLLLGIAASNGLPECFAAALLVPLLAITLFKATKLKPNQKIQAYKY